MMQTEQSYHYKVIARAIEIIDSEKDRELSLDCLAAKMNMSPAHFQRIFSKWVGISPKRYQQYLTLQHARSLLQADTTVHSTANAIGMSGPGRLHDLFLRWEAMSPGDYARRGAELQIRWGWFASPFGDLLAMGTEKGLCGLAFAADGERGTVFEDMKARWREAKYIEDKEAVRDWVQAALNQKGEAKLYLTGAPFQIKVWEALLSIPPGKVTTYTDVAQAAGFPQAVRATGTAVGRNPISWLIPCHRVIRKSGGLGGYHWGLPVKRALLAWESARREASMGVQSIQH